MGSLRSTTALLNSVAGNGVQELQGGNFLLLLTASLPVQVRIERGNGGHAEVFDNISGGLLIRRVQPWANLRLLGTAGTSVVFMYGTAETDKDETDIRLQIATIAGVASFAESPSAAIATPAAATRATGGADTIAANPLRRRITVSALSTNAGSLFIQAVGAGAGRGIELQGGTFVELVTTAAFDLRNDSGASLTYSIFEET